ncbi:MAG: four helix bundle protein [Kiritimatiellia bacterium]|jgi:four helix bundle protein
MKKNVVKEKSFAFALQIVRLAEFLRNEKHEYVLSKQVLRSGTAIGALVREAEHAESKADFIHKMSISLKEANETEYWIELLYQAHYLNLQQYNSIRPKIGDLNRLLITIIRTSKERGGK